MKRGARVQSYRERARMPPSRIPEAQVQAILAELRESGAYPDPAPPLVQPAPRARRGAGIGLAAIAGALMLGLAFSPLSDMLWSRPETPAVSPPAPLAPPTPVEPVLQPIPIEPTPATVTPAPPPVAAAAPVAKPRPKSRCLAGGSCGSADVAAAERRLRTAYSSASRAGVQRSVLSGYKVRWDAQRRRAARNPRTSVRTYRAMTAELNRKAAAARAD